MKILRVLTSGYQEGGAEIGVVHMQPLLEKRGHEIRSLASDSRPDLPHFNYYTYRAPHGPFAKLMYSFNPYAYFALKSALRDFKPDIVHLHTLGSASPLVLFALRKYPTVATVHGPEGYTRDLIMWCLPKSDFKSSEYTLKDLRLVGKLRYFYYRYINYPLYALGLRNVDRFVTISTYIYKVMKQQGIESTYIPNGIKLFPYKPLTKGKISHNIVFTGRLEKFKGLEYVLKALPDIIAQFPDTSLSIAGTGGDREDLELLSKKLGIEKHVAFLGYVGHSMLQELYEKASVVVVPSIWPETCSRSGVEGLSVGRPVVGSNVGGMPDWLLDGQTGYLVPPKDSSAISTAIHKLFANPDALIEMSKNARAKSEEYDIERHAQQVEKIYEELLREYEK